MRDFLLNEALKRLAADAAVRLSALVAGGEQIPFDVAEEDGPESAFYLYEPQTSRFVLEREEELRALPSFVPARDAASPAAPPTTVARSGHRELLPVLLEEPAGPPDRVLDTGALGLVGCATARGSRDDCHASDCSCDARTHPCGAADPAPWT